MGIKETIRSEFHSGLEMFGHGKGIVCTWPRGSTWPVLGVRQINKVSPLRTELRVYESLAAGEPRLGRPCARDFPCHVLFRGEFPSRFASAAPLSREWSGVSHETESRAKKDDDRDRSNFGNRHSRDPRIARQWNEQLSWISRTREH